MTRIPALILAASAAMAAPAFGEVLTYYSWDPVAQVYVEHTTIYEPDIVVTAPRASDDELITYDVMDRIATDPHLQGRVGVETYRRNVTLTGRVTSPVQVERAERDAKSVDGVRDVNNLLRARVGG